MAKASKTTKIAPEQEYKKELRRIKQFMSRASKRGFVWFDDPIPKQPKKITTKSVARLKRITPETLYKKSNFVDVETGEVLSGTKGRKLEKKRATEKANESRKTKQAKPKNSAKPKTKKEAKGKGKSKRKQLTQEEKDRLRKIADELGEKAEEKRKKELNLSRSKSKTKWYRELGKNNGEPEPKVDDAYYPSFTDVVLSNFVATLAQFPNAEGTPVLLAWFDKLIADNGREAVAQMLQDGAEQGLIITHETVYKSVNTKTYMTEMMRYLPDQGNVYSEQIMDMMEQFEWWEQPE